MPTADPDTLSPAERFATDLVDMSFERRVAVLRRFAAGSMLAGAAGCGIVVTAIRMVVGW